MCSDKIEHANSNTNVVLQAIKIKTNLCGGPESDGLPLLPFKKLRDGLARPLSITGWRKKRTELCNGTYTLYIHLYSHKNV